MHLYPEIFDYFQAKIDLVMNTKKKNLLLVFLLFPTTFALEVIDTGLGHAPGAQKENLVKDFGIFSSVETNTTLVETNTSLVETNTTLVETNTTLPSNFTICSSISTVDAKDPASFFQLLSKANDPWINICVLFMDKTSKVHKIKVMVS